LLVCSLAPSLSIHTPTRFPLDTNTHSLENARARAHTHTHTHRRRHCYDYCMCQICENYRTTSTPSLLPCRCLN
jgi:hypothetical protein